MSTKFTANIEENNATKGWLIRLTDTLEDRVSICKSLEEFKENLEKFNADPEYYTPQYGGYCAYAIGKNGDKVKIDPKTFEIRDGKLYLFYHTFFANTLEKWLEEGAEELKKDADKNWIKIKSTSK